MPLPVSNDPVTDQGRLYVSPSLPVGDGGLPIAPVADPDAAAMANVPTDGNANVPNVATRVINKLLGTGGEERYKTWPEKLLRDALSAPHDVLNSPTPSTSGDLIKLALDMSALAGTGGLGGVGEGGAAALGSSPFLRPALKYEGKIYKAPMGGEHMDAIPETLRPEFTKQAMSGEDISNFNFGFMNHKGQFLDREKALKYAIDEGLLSPHDAKYGALTSTLMADSSKEAAAIKAYHGSTADIGKFNPSKGGEFGPGVYFADTPEMASYFGGRNGSEGLNITPATLNMKNPVTITKQEWNALNAKKTPMQIQKMLKDKGHDGIIGIGSNGIDKQYIPFDLDAIKTSIGKE